MTLRDAHCSMDLLDDRNPTRDLSPHKMYDYYNGDHSLTHHPSTPAHKHLNVNGTRQFPTTD